MRLKLSPELVGLLWKAAFVLAAAGGTVLVALVLPRYVGDIGIVIVPVLLVAFVAAMVCLIVPTETLPAIAVAVFVLIPARLLNQEGPLGALPVTSLILVIWAFRRLIVFGPRSGAPDSLSASVPETVVLGRLRRLASDPLRIATQVFGLFFFGWALFTLLRSSEVQTSSGWLISFVAGALIPLVFPRAQREADHLRRVWMVLGAVLGAYAVVEAVLRANPIWGTLYSALGVEGVQHWSVYRAEVSFGHPLFAGLFFAVACALATGIWLTSASRWTLLAAALSGLGLVATISRGALLATAITLVFCYLAALVLRGEKRWSRFALLGALAVVSAFGLLQFDALAARNDSAEAELSTYARERGFVVALQAASLSDWLGSGPGTSGITGRLIDEVTIENSGLQLLISVGIPGLLLFVGLIASAFLHALSKRGIGEAGGILAYAICIAGFNAIDALRAMHLLLGALLILTLNPSTAADRPPIALPRSFRRQAVLPDSVRGARDLIQTGGPSVGR